MNSFFNPHPENFRLLFLIWGISVAAFSLIQWVLFPIIGRRFIYKEVAKLYIGYVRNFESKILSSVASLVLAAPTPFIFFLTPQYRNQILSSDAYFHRSFAIQSLCATYTGYICSDAVTLVINRKTNSELIPWIIHHTITFLLCSVPTYWGEYHLGTLLIMTSDFTTPFVNNIYIFSILGLDYLTKINSTIILILWVIFRLFLAFAFIHYLTFRNWGDIVGKFGKSITEVVISNIVLPASLGLLNCFWFVKLLKGYIKIMTGGLQKRPEKRPRRKLTEKRI